ncbi:hypothetical protein PC116_g27700 [Phytophthora cactorum]|nr:hypothetical protein Pcac1_g5697 [Phytophthora cactorum]KAG2872966.1 hypothetical protein PC114_g26093 [Phytophthora cactorum]KAG4044416.1 hypothetical protein PC123_g20143 [Phytophthora cactorum]KAG4223840.1 hypothetical protein PC116_g27700 [Phytophthora cactorum]
MLFVYQFRKLPASVDDMASGGATTSGDNWSTDPDVASFCATWLGATDEFVSASSTRPSLSLMLVNWRKMLSRVEARTESPPPTAWPISA